MLVDPDRGGAAEFGRVLQLQFSLDVRAVGVQRVRAEKQLAGNLAAFHTLPDQAKDFQLAVGQSFRRIR